MIELTVKTLDSKNHAFSVPDDITVKQLKERIADSVNISADSQRLIYCGRVLQDEKNLSEYDVNGKVIHLVQRAPPVSNGSGPDRSASGARSGAGANVRRTPRRVFVPSNANVPGNAMYLGAVAFPGEIMDASGISMQQPRQCLSQSRINVARSMLRRASDVLSRLEHNSQNSAGTSPDNGNGPSEATSEDAASGSVPVAAAGSIATAFTAVEQNVPVNISSSGEPPEPIIEVVIQSSDMQDLNPGLSVAPEPQAPQPSEQQAASNEGEGEGGNSRYPRTRALAELMDQVTEVNTRLAPFMTQYQRLMLDDPTFSDNATADASQRLFSHVSDLMHNMAHAYHALSDIMCDFSQPPPRFLRCRPVLIHHSAVVQTGIPIQVATSFTTTPSSSNQQNGASQPGGTTASGSPPSTNSASPATTEETVPPQPSMTQAEEVTVTSTTPQAPAAPAAAASVGSTTNQQQPAAATPRGARLGDVIGNGTGFEIFVDVAPGSITIDSVEAAVVTNAPANSADGNMWQNPPEFVQNLISALAGQFMGATVQQFRFPDQQNVSSTGTNTSGTSTTPTTAATTSQQQSGNGNGQPTGAASGAQNSQARGNTATHPTTATQTRSTARPHVHFAPGSIHGLGRNHFDPFLPCNSHHIRSTRGGRQRANSFHATNTNSASATNNASDIPTARVAPSRTEMQGANSVTVELQAEPPSGERGMPRLRLGAVLHEHPRLPPEIQSLMQALGNANQQSDQPGPRITNFTIGALLQAIQTGQPVQLQTGMSPSSGSQNSMAANQPPTTLAQMLENVPGYSYTPGESILTDTFMILAQCLSFMDMIQLGMGGSECLLRARPQLRQLISQRLLNNQPFTISAITQIIDRLNAELRPFYSVFENTRMREEVDLPASINLYNHSMLPSILNTVMKEDQSTFHISLVRKCTSYVRQLCALLQYCCLDGVTGLETVLRALVTQMNSNVPGILQEWTMTHSIINFRTFASSLNVPVDDIKRFLVYRMGNPANSPQPATSPPPVPPAAEPMDVQDVDTVEVNHMREPPVADTPPTHQNLDDAFGALVQGALPSEWVPIITRDSQRQRRQNPQGPFSDAYLSGMPSKRRKLVTSAKPQGNLSQVITESMTTALGAAGMSSGPEVDVIAQRAGQDDTLRSAYREQVRTTLGQNLNSNPDYLPEKYPNTAKYFKKH